MNRGHNGPPADEWTVEELAPILRAVQNGLDPALPNWQRTLLDHLEVQFEQEGHPLTPWFALRWARDHRIRMPSWVTDYFYDRGRAIQRVINAPAPEHNEAEAVGRQLGFHALGRGQASPGAAAVRRANLWQMAFEMAIEARHAAERGEHFKKDAGREAVSVRHGCSTDKVRAAEKEFGPIVERQAAVLFVYLGVVGNGDLPPPKG